MAFTQVFKAACYNSSETPLGETGGLSRQRLLAPRRLCPARPTTFQVCCLQTDTSTSELTLPRRLAEQFLVVQYPAAHNTLYKAALKDFAGSAVLAYECGYSEGVFQQQFEHELQQLPSTPAHLQEFDMDRCRCFLSLVWITIMLAPKRTVVRWSKGCPVEDATLAAWRGFVAMICRGWFDKRWAWYPIDRLQMELSMTSGQATPPAIVSEWAGVVYATLESVAPQFPSR